MNPGHIVIALLIVGMVVYAYRKFFKEADQQLVSHLEEIALPDVGEPGFGPQDAILLGVMLGRLGLRPINDNGSLLLVNGERVYRVLPDCIVNLDTNEALSFADALARFQGRHSRNVNPEPEMVPMPEEM